MKYKKKSILLSMKQCIQNMVWIKICVCFFSCITEIGKWLNDLDIILKFNNFKKIIEKIFLK